MKLKYKVQVNLTGIDKDNKQIDKVIEEYFVDSNPILSRQQAISKLNSYIDIFDDAKNSGQPILQTWNTAFDENLNDFQIPSFELFYCPSQDGLSFKEFPLYSYTLLETEEELYTELKDELTFIKKQFPDIQVDTDTFQLDGNLYSFIKDTPIMEL